MRKLLFIASLLFASLSFAGNGASISTFTGTENGFILDIGINSLRFETILTESSTAHQLKLATSFSDSSKLWFGFGSFLLKETVTDNTDTWVHTSREAVASPYSVFIEYEHNSGFFARVTHYEGTAKADFYKQDPNNASLNIVKRVNKKFQKNLVWVGYKLYF